MKNSFLLDTHTLLWFLNGDRSLPTSLQKIISDPSNRCFFSIASIWEIAIKLKIGKLDLDFDLEMLPEHLIANNFEVLTIDFAHILKTLDLKDYHRDPFDRIIIAQGIVEKLTVISKDENFKKYSDIKLLW